MYRTKKSLVADEVINRYIDAEVQQMRARLSLTSMLKTIEDMVPPGVDKDHMVDCVLRTGVLARAAVIAGMN